MSQALLTGLARTTRPQVAVRRFLALDAVVTGGNGIAYAVASGPLGEFLGVDPGCCSNSASCSPCTPPGSPGSRAGPSPRRSE